MDDRKRHLAQELAGDVPEAETEAVLRSLDAFTAPEPSLAATSALVGRLRPLVPPPSRRRFREEGLLTSPWAILLGCMRAQLRLLKPVWWVVSAVVTAAWVVLTAETGLAPALIAPPLAICGLTYLLRQSGTPAEEMELSCPVRPVHVMLARMLLILGWVTALGVGCSAGLWLTGNHPSVWPTFAAWGAGALLFGGLTLTIMLYVGPRGALGLTLLAWVILMGLGMARTMPGPVWLLPNGAAALAGLLLAAAAVWLGPSVRRRAPGQEG